MAKSARPRLMVMKGREPIIGNDGGPSFSWWRPNVFIENSFFKMSMFHYFLRQLVKNYPFLLSPTEAWRKTLLLLLVVNKKKKKEQKDQKKKRNHCTLWSHFQFVRALCKISETKSYVQRFESCHLFYKFTLSAPILKSALLT